MISKIENSDFLTYAVWEPMLKTDTERSARKATSLLPDARVQNYWTRTTSVGELFQKPINLTTEPAWDVYLVYEPGVVWEGDSPPKPTFFMHQLGGRLPDGQRLDGPELRNGLEEILKR
ncbi:MAG: hypothetical protein HKN21_00755 [Candidatus Eisenbacteria bacterium]|uniref:Uncharacterized protein n=1 Tax=Eiseniibacteriota bacterium TaxID=2212470 RepID=A0A7Y2E4W5_UNCEI|nr:hypothetical protein [Candidatus Eisenbacteria bacterium]